MVSILCHRAFTVGVNYGLEIICSEKHGTAQSGGHSVPYRAHACSLAGGHRENRLHFLLRQFTHQLGRKLLEIPSGTLNGLPEPYFFG